MDSKKLNRIKKTLLLIFNVVKSAYEIINK